jgi:hypothetical protein
MEETAAATVMTVAMIKMAKMAEADVRKRRQRQ